MERIDKDIFSIAKRMQSKERGVLTGFPDLDAMTLGLQKGELTIIAGRPSMGKTSLMTQIILNIDKPIVVASLEMSKQLLGERLISQVSGVGLHTIKSARMRSVDKVRARDALEKISKREIHFLGKFPLEDPHLESTLVEAAPACVFIDFLQLMRLSDGFMSTEREISLIITQLKELAIKLDIPLVVLSQLNRLLEQRESHVPYLSDLRGSGSLEQTADVVLLLHRPAYYRITGDDPDAEDDGEAWLYLAKNRSGPVGKIEYKWDKETMSFTENSARFHEFGELL